MNLLPGNMRFGAGQPVKRLEDQRLLTGKGQFIDDKPGEGALWLHVLRSPHAHAKIVSVDTKAAAGMPGVAAVYTGADLVADGIGTIPTLSVFMRPDGKPMTVPPRRLLAHELVRFAGEPVAAVVATSRVAAQTAAEAISVEYEILPSVVDPIEATKPGAPAVWAEAPDNIVAAMGYGDAAASRVVRYTTVDDVGVAVNPMLVTGQVHGGVAQGIGQALYEGVSYDAEGQLLTASYQDYCLPRADDIPPIEVTLDQSAPCRTNPLGAKGCGESGAIGGPPCITNGVMDALSDLGIKTLHTPLTPMKVWQAIQEAKAARA
jgi:CO/xanthine dehydrogenase Mo-binding subunit